VRYRTTPFALLCLVLVVRVCSPCMGQLTAPVSQPSAECVSWAAFFWAVIDPPDKEVATEIPVWRPWRATAIVEPGGKVRVEILSGTASWRINLPESPLNRLEFFDVDHDRQPDLISYGYVGWSCGGGPFQVWLSSDGYATPTVSKIVHFPLALAVPWGGQVYLFQFPDTNAAEACMVWSMKEERLVELPDPPWPIRDVALYRRDRINLDWWNVRMNPPSTASEKPR
jgi:hypothetical protein